MRVLLTLTLAVLVAVPAYFAVQDPTAPGETGVEGPAEPTTAAALTHFTTLTPIARYDPGDIRDIKLRGDHAFAAGHTGIHILDISDPADPTPIGFLHCPSRDLAVVGDVLAAVREGSTSASCGGSNRGVAIVDISDPTDPVYVKGFNIGAHTITAQGDSGYIHVASSDLVRDLGSPGFQDILYAPDPAGTHHAKRFQFPIIAQNGQPVNAPSCHEITFSADLTRAYCAGVTETHIWDTTDPLDIEILAVITNPGISIHHGAFVDADKEILVLNDEFLGVVTNLADACLPAGDRVPYGALWFYDVSNEAAPVPLSSIQADSTKLAPNLCTSHFGNILPNDEQLVWGWYEAGPVLVDFSDPLLPVMHASFVVPGALTWAAYHHDGHVFTGDMARGFEVFALS